jgi:hypothetical protein
VNPCFYQSHCRRSHSQPADNLAKTTFLCFHAQKLPDLTDPSDKFMQLKSERSSLMLAKFVLIFGIGILLCDGLFAASLQSIALIKNVEGATKAEAMTTSARGGSALYYNPACLVFNSFDLQLIGIEAIVDRRLVDAKKEYDERKKIGDTNLNANSEENLKRVYDLLFYGNDINATANAHIINFSVPYAAIQSFASTSVTTGTNDASQNASADLTSRAGVIGGFAIKIGSLAIGISKYFLIESSIHEEISFQQISSIRQAMQEDPATIQSIRYSDFTKATLGNSEGYNLGTFYQFIKDNPSGIGISILNAGASPFRKALPRRYAKLNSYQNDYEQKADEYGIELELPAKIPQLTNLGILMGMGGGAQDIFTANLALDYDDLNGEYLDVDRKFAASTEVGLILADEMAMLLRGKIPFYNPETKETKGAGIYVGLLGFKLNAGVRPNDRYTYGVSLLGHAGNQSVSLLKFALQTLVEKPLNSNMDEQFGFQGNISLTLILPPK